MKKATTKKQTNQHRFVHAITGGHAIIIDYNGPGGDVVIPASILGVPVTGIWKMAFYKNDDLMRVEIPDCITSIEDGAFARCGHLTNVSFGYGVTNIGKYAFNECPNLSGVLLPESVSSIGFAAFGGCKKLNRVSIGKRVSYVKNFTFSRCPRLKVVCFHGNVPTFEKDVFARSRKVTVFYQSGATGWGKRFGGRPTKQVDALDAL